MKNTLVMRVRAGIAFLNSRIKGWKKKINLKELDLGDGCHCILGQLDGDYETHREELELSEQTASDLGFNLTDDYSWENNKEYKDLTKTWKKEIRKRR